MIGIFDLFRRKSVWKEPDIEKITRYYFKKHQEKVSLISQPKDIETLTILLGEHILAFSIIDLDNLNELLTECNIKKIENNEGVFVIEMASFYIAQVRNSILSLIDGEVYPCDHTVIEKIIYSVICKYTELIDVDSPEKKLLINTLTESINEILEKYDYSITKTTYNYCCSRLLTSVNYKDNYAIASHQLFCLTLASSRAFSTFILPILEKRYRISSGS